MNSSQRERPTSGVEVVDTSAHGIWLLAGDAEHFLPFKEFPWFKIASVSAVLNVREELPGAFTGRNSTSTFALIQSRILSNTP